MSLLPAFARVPVPPRQEDFTSRLRTPTVTARIGLWLGITFGICFVTGVISHWLQHPPFFFVWPTRPVDLYRWTQGLHVIAGTASIPLLGAKLWTIFPRLFASFDLSTTRQKLITIVERGSILALVGSSVFLLFTGLFDTAQYYPWGFFFTAAHRAMAWVAIGSVLVHIAIKLPVIRTALGVPVGAEVDSSQTPGVADVFATHVDPAPVVEPEPGPAPQGVSRRTFLRATWLSAGVAVVATAGVTVPALRPVSVLGGRSGAGPQGVPINKTAEQAGVVEQATAQDWAVTISGPDGPRSFTLAELNAMPQTTQTLPIACVEGWSVSAEWTGVAVPDLVAAVGGSSAADVRFTSFDPGTYGISVLPGRHAASRLSLLALRLNGEVLSLDHGFPARLIAPSRPGVTQTKWVTTMDVL